MRHYPQRAGSRPVGASHSDMLCSRCILNFFSRYYTFLFIWLLALSPFIVMTINYHYRPLKPYIPKVPSSVPEPTIATDDPELNIGTIQWICTKIDHDLEWEDDMSDLENETWLHEQDQKTVKLPSLDDLIRYEEWSKTSTDSSVTEEIEVIKPIPMHKPKRPKKGPPKLQ